MAALSTLDTLIDLATKDTDEATKRLGRCIRAADEAQQKLSVLQQYRDDYGLRFQESMQAGLTPMQYRNFQLFIEKIEVAINGQNSLVETAKLRISEARTVWQGCERKRMSYDTLATRARLSAQQRESKLDQKQTDEHASRMAFYSSKNRQA
ncbi:flagellar export protein FliJ [Herbaspirillum sp. RTI4]|uniref:flagellar export protein FliJ n=1 Tax=Herbaspirillum sp. RTI4 TaxID=3048640 RepID=UPI002AB569D8|nr:flagellar export protein FliJ [Herbaspirillum sp. RTI4]MDY7578315.1 flagellar export protein FliJ [Herbaspirillum sp. RTI4]MEA9981192.1 flagellar export protein FliJ [Herbaspirillum sp. RTI4]